MTAPTARGRASTARPPPGGADAAATALYAAHFERLVALAARVLGDADEAEDVAQEALIAACAALGRGHRLARPAAWLTRAARNLAVSRLRARRGRDRLRARLGAAVGNGATAVPLDADSAAVVEEAEAVRRLVAALDALRPRHRDALLRHLHGAGGAAAAAALGLTEAAWRARLGRAREALRLALRRSGSTPAEPRPPVSARRAWVADLHARGWRPAAIARALGVARGAVMSDLAALRHQSPPAARPVQLWLFGDRAEVGGRTRDGGDRRSGRRRGSPRRRRVEAFTLPLWPAGIPT